jgi:hypothetical protein
MKIEQAWMGASYAAWTGLAPPAFRYLYHLDPQARFLYVETPKVCCTTIKRTLQYVVTDGDLTRIPAQVHDRDASPITPVPGQTPIADIFFKDPGVFTFCYVRNPYTRILSAYLDKMIDNAWEFNRLAPRLGLSLEQRPSFLEFLQAIVSIEDIKRDIHFRSQVSMLQPNRINYDYIGRFESFSRSFPELLKRLFPENLEKLLAIRGDAHRTEASARLGQFYGDTEIALVRAIYDADFHAFGYGRALGVPE